MAATAAFVFAGYSQVTVDWSTDAIVAPVQINTTVQNGSTVNYHFVGKNNGTDTVRTGDTLLFQVALFTTSNQLIVAAPSASNFYFRVINRDLPPSDTFSAWGTFTFGLYPTFSANVNVVVLSHVIHRARGLNFEGSGGLANNTKSKQVVWYNPQGWGVSVKDVEAQMNPTVFPNQTSGKFTVSLPVLGVNETTSINIYNMQGQLVRSIQTAPGISSADIDASELASGSYVVETANSQFRSSTTLLIQK